MQVSENCESATRTGAQVAGPIPLLQLSAASATIIRATHKYKDSREHLKVHTQTFDRYHQPNSKTVDALMKLIFQG